MCLRYKAMAFAASGFLGAVGGGLLASLSTYLDPAQFGITQSVYFLAVAVVGGMSSPFGAIIGSAMFILHPRPAAIISVLSWSGVRLAAARLHRPASERSGERPAVALPQAPFPPACRRAAMTDALLHVDNITVRFGGIVALDRVSLDVGRGSIHAVIGPNGAGKSTMLNVITGLYAVDGGAVSFEGERIDGRAPHTIRRLGIARTFQNTELFGEMSAIENVMVGLDRHHPYNLAIGMSHGPGYRRSEIAARREAGDLLALVGIADDAAVAAAALPFGKQRRLELARALATRPKLLLLDEPAAGLRAAEIESLNLILLNLRAEQGLTILRHRSRHGAGDDDLRSDHRSELRPEDCRRQSGYGAQVAGSHSGLSGRKGGTCSRCVICMRVTWQERSPWRQPGGAARKDRHVAGR